ncbi:DUF2567 domain-containing protein [Asanoa sp. NPDC050611]|uniref:DUF2567 domain-containing protein n=1 Tax=Asanoa sp. NPDC050611 TaxID=3157098 RepID=UPI0033F26445
MAGPGTTGPGHSGQAATGPGSDFTGATAPGSDFTGATAPDSDRTGATAPGSDVTGAVGPGSDFGQYGTAASADPAWPAAPAPAPRLPLKKRLGAAGLTAVVVAVVGAPLGLLWTLVAPGVPIIKTDDGAVFATPSPEEFIASDGWFTILLFALGVVAALVTWIAFKRYRGPLTLVALMVGTVGASVLAWQVGRRIGIGDYRAEILAAQPGDMIIRPPDLRAGGFTKLWDVVPFVHGDLLIATFGAVIVYTLLAGWSRTPSLRPDARVQLPPQPTNPFYVLNDRPHDPPEHPGR